MSNNQIAGLLPAFAASASIAIGDAVENSNGWWGIVTKADKHHLNINGRQFGYNRGSYKRITNDELRFRMTNPPLIPGQLIHTTHPMGNLCIVKYVQGTIVVAHRLHRPDWTEYIPLARVTDRDWSVYARPLPYVLESDFQRYYEKGA